jgi:hypothetical protein
MDSIRSAEMVERVARALCKWENEAIGCDGIKTGFLWDYGSNADNWRAQARAAIEVAQPMIRATALEDVAYIVSGEARLPSDPPDSEELKTFRVSVSSLLRVNAEDLRKQAAGDEVERPGR